jgi:branched-chain amino acid transport system permease protein
MTLRSANLNTTIMLVLQDGITNTQSMRCSGLRWCWWAVTRHPDPAGRVRHLGALNMPCWRPARCWHRVVCHGDGRGRFALICSMRAIAAASYASLLVSTSACWLPSALTHGVASPTAPIAINIALCFDRCGDRLFLSHAFQPIAHTSVLVLLIASVGCHLALQGLGLVFFGAEGLRGPALSNTALTIGPLRFTGRALRSTG